MKGNGWATRLLVLGVCMTMVLVGVQMIPEVSAKGGGKFPIAYPHDNWLCFSPGWTLFTADADTMYDLTHHWSAQTIWHWGIFHYVSGSLVWWQPPPYGQSWVIDMVQERVGTYDLQLYHNYTGSDTGVGDFTIYGGGAYWIHNCGTVNVFFKFGQGKVNSNIKTDISLGWTNFGPYGAEQWFQTGTKHVSDLQHHIFVDFYQVEYCTMYSDLAIAYWNTNASSWVVWNWDVGETDFVITEHMGLLVYIGMMPSWIEFYPVNPQP
jgi:hypothetical protein